MDTYTTVTLITGIPTIAAFVFAFDWNRQRKRADRLEAERDRYRNLWLENGEATVNSADLLHHHLKAADFYDGAPTVEKLAAEDALRAIREDARNIVSNADFIIGSGPGEEKEGK